MGKQSCSKDSQNSSQIVKILKGSERIFFFHLHFAYNGLQYADDWVYLYTDDCTLFRGIHRHLQVQIHTYKNIMCSTAFVIIHLTRFIRFHKLTLLDVDLRVGYIIKMWHSAAYNWFKIYLWCLFLQFFRNHLCAEWLSNIPYLEGSILIRFSCQPYSTKHSNFRNKISYYFDSSPKCDAGLSLECQ